MRGAGVLSARGRGPRGLATPALVALALGVGAALRYGRYTLDADSVAQQSILLTWLHAGHGTTFVPRDTWLLKLPVYLAVEALPLAGELRLAIESAALAGIGFALVVWACLSLGRQAGFAVRGTDAALPVAWLLTLAGAFGGYLAVMPNFRNLEVGAAFALLTLAARVRSARAAVGTAAALAVVWLDDPYFGYVTALPLAAGCALRAWRRRDRRYLLPAAAVVASLAVQPLLQKGLAALGIVVVEDYLGLALSPPEVGRRLALLGPSLDYELGWGRPGRTTALAAALGVAVLLAGVAGSVLLARRGWRSTHPALLVLAGQALLVVAAVVVNVTVVDFHAGRYLMPAIVALAATAGLGAAAVRTERPRLAAAVTAVLAVATVANVAHLALDRPPRPATYAAQDGVLAAIRASGATKGIAEYWSTNPYVHATRGAVQVAPVACRDGRLWRVAWITDTARLAVPAGPTGRTFLVWENGIWPDCPRERLTAQLGTPVETVPIPSWRGAGQSWLLVYDHDVTPSLD